MILFGEKAIIESQDRYPFLLNRPITIYLNLGSLYNIGERLSGLLKPLSFIIQSIQTDNREFDMQYASMLMQDDESFIDIMKIVYPEYFGLGNTTVVVLYDQSASFTEYVIISLAKFLQQRYGLEVFFIKEPQDLECVYQSVPNIFGVANLDADKERYIQLVQKPEYWIQGGV